ncbi:condensation domain-containing protein [Amycolatopsis australiensis]|uniref:Non-ribosomal peptide synthetase component F n=1 Tax=Amycolatopsis australiensis TaxID=546364 RepID=A0A1K1RM98_9PSEU|nr:condensation domain-containing protein [Amycolatopsis australiensis]SFW72923.1 Non-ribosomal peptide synthetase component F [Amycolatopsis australiensis]
MRSATLTPERRRLLEQLLDARGVAPTAARVGVVSGDRDALPLSLMQQRIWFFDRLQPNSTIYNVAGVARLRGPVDREVLRRALEEVVRRHEVLRTTFAQIDGRAVQRVRPAPRLELPVEDLGVLPEDERDRALETFCRAETSRPFDLGRDLMLRPRLVRTGDEDYRLVLVQHHIATDGWSVNLLLKEIGELYGAFAQGRPSPLPELEVQYGDFAAWQRDLLSGEVLDRKLGYWKESLAGAGLLDLPWIGRRRPLDLSWDGASLQFRLPPGLCRRIRELADTEQATPYMVLLSALSIVLTRWTEQTEAVIGCPIANRTRAELESLIGCFVNTLPLRMDLSGTPTFREVLRRARELCHGGYENQEVPFETMVEAVNPARDATSHVPLIRHQLGLHNEPRSSVELSGVTFEVQTLSTGTVRFDMEIDLGVDEDGGISGPVYYSTDLFTQDVVEQVLDAFATVLEAAVAEPDSPAAALPLLGPAQRDFVAAAGLPSPRESAEAATVHGVLERHADARPDAEAVVCGPDRLSRRELDERANGLARHLLDLGVSGLAVHLPASADLVVAVLAGFKAGARVTTLNPAHPRKDVRAALRDSGATLVLTGSGHWHPGLLGGTKIDVSFVDKEGLTTRRAARPDHIVPPEAGALPGRSHVAVLDRLRHGAARLGCTAEDTVLFAGPAELDLAPARWLTALAAGARLLIGAGEPLTGLIDTERVTVAELPPAVLPQLVAEPPRSLRELVAVGELWPALAKDLRAALPGTKLSELHGPGALGLDRVVVSDGRATSDVRMRVLDAHGGPVAPGVAGELFLAAPAAGEPVADPFDGVPLQRTGLRARLHADGHIGLVPAALRVASRRVEADELLATLTENEDVDRASVVVDAEAPGGPELLAYVSLRDTARNRRTNVPDVVKRARWRKEFEQTYTGRGAEDDPTVNTAGWNSRSTGEYVSPEEMREWSDLTLRRISGLRPATVLEVGCRNGQLLFRLAMRCDSYAATDLSARALGHIREHEQWLATKAQSVELREQPADDFSGFADGQFDAVVVNSLAQYFPEPDYLRRVLTEAVRVVRPGGTIYLGDVRSLPLLPALHLSVQTGRLAPATPVSRLRQAIQARTELEEDLVLDPALFDELAAAIDGITGVTVLPRTGRHHNELTGYRYDVLFRVGAHEAAPEAEALDWSADGLTAADVRARLADGVPRLVLTGVPDARLTAELAAVRLLAGELVDTVGDLLDAARPVLGEPGSPVELPALLALAAEFGYEALAGSPRGADVDLVLAREGDPLDRLAAILDRPAPVAAAPANDPRRAIRVKAAVPALTASLRERHPSHALPAEVVVLREWPLRADGAVDTAGLPEPDRSAREEAKASREPSTETERRIAEIWADALGLDRIGVFDDFFSLGGHSLMGAEVVERVRAVYDVELPLGRLFESPTVASVAEYVDGALAESGPAAATAPIKRVDRDSYRKRRAEPAGAGGTRR